MQTGYQRYHCIRCGHEHSTETARGVRHLRWKKREAVAPVAEPEEPQPQPLVIDKEKVTLEFCIWLQNNFDYVLQEMAHDVKK